MRNAIFSFQENQFFGECLPCTAAVFNQLVDSCEVASKIETRQAVEKAIKEEGPLDSFVQSADFQKFRQNQMRDPKTASHFELLTTEQQLQQWVNSLKESLPCFIFGVSGFEQVTMTDKNGNERLKCRRKQEGIIGLSGLFMFDADHLVIDPRVVYERTQAEGFPWKLGLAHKTSSGQGLRLVLVARPEVGNIADNQIELARCLGLLGMTGTTGKPVTDESCIDATRISYCPRRDDIYYSDEQVLFGQEDEREDGYFNDFDKMFREDYRQGKTQPVDPTHAFDSKAETGVSPIVKDCQVEQANTPQVSIEKFGHPLVDYVYALLPNGAPVNTRHDWMLKVFTDLLILCDNNENQARSIILTFKWVQDVIKERGMQELENIIDSAKKRNKKRESENLYSLQPSMAMRRAIEQVTKRKYSELVRELQKQATGTDGSGQQDDVTMLLERIGVEIQKLMPHYPLLRLLCHRQKRKHYIAAMLVGGAFGMTLMTRCWYKFWSEPGRTCRLNCILELIGRSGSGKHIAADLYELMMLPIKQADANQIDALNKWNEEKEMNSGANKNKTIRPKGILRCLPSESSASAIRDALFNAKEEVDGVEWPLHVFQFNSELDDLLSQQKKSYMNIEALFLKSFHNEQAGSLLKTSSSIVGEVKVHFNGVYTGTSDALNQQTTPANFARGSLFRLTVVPMGDSNFEMREYREYTSEDKLRDDQIRQWAYNLDKTKGEIPCQDLSKALHDWTEAQMNDAREENSQALEDLCKRPCWHAVNFALPFIVSRHWDQMVDDEDGRKKCGPAFATDRIDRKLTLLLVNAQMAFQKHFFLGVGEQFFENQRVVAISGHHPTQRLQQAYKRLPDPFTSDDVAKEYSYESRGSITNRLKRLQDDGLAEKIRCGVDKGKYRKLL